MASARSWLARSPPRSRRMPDATARTCWAVSSTELCVWRIDGVRKLEAPRHVPRPIEGACMSALEPIDDPQPIHIRHGLRRSSDRCSRGWFCVECARNNPLRSCHGCRCRRRRARLFLVAEALSPLLEALAGFRGGKSAVSARRRLFARSLRVPAGPRHGLGLLSRRPRPLRQCTLPSATDRRSCVQVAPSAKGGKRLDWTCLGTKHEQDLNGCICRQHGNQRVVDDRHPARLAPCQTTEDGRHLLSPNLNRWCFSTGTVLA